MPEEQSNSEAALLAAADRAMERYADGDDAAFEQVFAAIGQRIRKFLRRLCGSDELALDLLQETLLRLHQSRGAFRPGSPVLPWAYTIARNVFLDAARSRKRAPARVDLDDAQQQSAVSVPAEAESTLLARQTAALVERALGEMTPARREAFVLLRFEGLSVAVAAEVLGVSENAVKLRAFQAYEIIREKLSRLEQARPLR
ncbi:MAG: RNA polymerase sigma factor [Polyangiaceae bacterium]